MTSSLEQVLLSHWRQWFSESPPAALDFVVVGQKYRDFYTLLAMHGDGRESACVVKIAADGEQAPRLRREFENLMLLRSHLADQGLLDSIPAPLALEECDRLVIIVSSYISGRGLAGALGYPRRQKTAAQALDRVAHWLAAFAAAGRALSPARDDGLEQPADALAAFEEEGIPFQEFLCSGGEGGVAAFQEMRRSQGFRHGDLKPGHILWRDGTIGVLDWSEMKPGSVAGDWFYFLTLSALQLGGAESLPQLSQTAPTLEAIFFSDHWFSKLAAQATWRLLDRLALPWSAAGPLFALSVWSSRFRWPYLAHEPFGAYGDVLHLLRRRWADLVFNRAKA